MCDILISATITHDIDLEVPATTCGKQNRKIIHADEWNIYEFMQMTQHGETIRVSDQFVPF